MRCILSLMLAATLAGCGEHAQARQQSAAAKAGTAQPRKVQLVKVERRKLARSVQVSGTLAADEQVTVSAKVSGRLESIAVDLGTAVKRGQAIAQLEPTDYRLRAEQALSALGQARALLGLPPEGDGDESKVDVDATSLVRQAQASYEEARANFERNKSLLDQRLIAVADFDTAKAAFLRAETAVATARDEIRNRQATVRQRSFELRAARQQLADTVVRSPLDGVVQQRLALAGEYLQAGAGVATIVNVDPLRLRADVPERDAPQVHVGQEVRVTVDGVAQVQQGKVARLAPALSEQNRTLAIEAEIANPGTLRPGSFARAEIAIDGGDEVAVVPQSALLSFAGIDKLIVVEHGKAVEKPVVTGRHQDEWVEIVSGIAAGDEVVREPGNLQQGQAVEVQGHSHGE
jgi:RND family efflux transporter MFP subunit